MIWNLSPLLLREKIRTFVILLNCGSLQPGCDFFLSWWDISVRVLTISMLSLYPLLLRCCSSRFQAPLWGDYPICSCGSVVSVEGNEFRIILCHHLEPSFTILFLILILYLLTLLHSCIRFWTCGVLLLLLEISWGCPHSHVNDFYHLVNRK